MNRQPPPSYVAFVKDVATQLLNPTTSYVTSGPKRAKTAVLKLKDKK